MKLKVTVEFEEGVKKTIHRSLTTVKTIMLMEDKLESTVIEELVELSVFAAQKATRDIYNAISAVGTVLEYSENDERKVVGLNNLNLSNLTIIQRKALNDKIVNWQKNKKKLKGV
jgi:hypothetical protein